jgi:uncharacterized protein involved in tolerance to divalent cations
MKTLKISDETHRKMTDKYERLEATVKEMNTPYHSASDFVHTQIDEVLEKYDRWLEEKEEHEKRQRKK